jgi:short-subunit dehydrogenase
MTHTHKKTIAIFGAGTGLGTSVAFRFGREGYRVALVARRKAGLDDIVAQLTKAGVDASAFPFDLAHTKQIPELVKSIHEKLGGIDVAVYAPVTPEVGFVPAAQLDAAQLEPLTQLYLLSPVEVAHAVLPSLLARGGAFVLGGGITAIHPLPGMSGVGPAIAGARNFIFTLNAELKEKGVYAGTVTIGASIERSGLRHAMEASGQNLDAYPSISPDAIAEEIWALVSKRDRVEAVLPPFPSM